MEAPICAPLCGASKAYGRYVKWWQHDHRCPCWLVPDPPPFPIRQEYFGEIAP